MSKSIAITGDTAADRILSAWKKNAMDKLSEDDKSILDRITEVEKRFYEKKLVRIKGKDVERPFSWKDLVSFLKEKYKISHRQAYADIELAKQFFLLARTRTDKEFARGYRIMQGEEMMHQAVDSKDFKSAAAFFKEITKLEGLDRWDDAEADPSIFQPMKPIIVADPSELGFPKMENPDAIVERLKKSFKKGTIDKMLADAEETDYIEENEGSEDMAE